MTSTLLRTGLVAALALAGVLTGGGVAVADHVAGHPAPPAPEFRLPTAEEALFPVYSVCDDLAPAGNLPRRTCQSFVTATLEPFSDPQVFTYAPPNTLTPPVIPPATPRPAYVPPQELPPLVPPLSAEEAAPRPQRPLPERPAVDTVAEAGPTVTANGDPMASRNDPEGCVPDAVRGFDGFDPALDPDNDGVSCESPTTTVPQADSDEGLVPLDMAIAYGLAAAAALVLIATIGLPLLRRAGRHRSAE